MNPRVPFHQLQQALRPERHVVFATPEIHWNTGNAGRTCLAVGARLHLIKPLGFSLDSKEVRRAGLDYWQEVDLTVWDSFDEMIIAMAPKPGEVAVFSKAGSRSFWNLPQMQRLFLVFGSETRGLPESILARYSDCTYHIPITDRTRSLNLSTAAGIALYESLRGAPVFHAWGTSK